MTLQEVSFLRLVNQQLAGSRFKTAGEIVHWMGAMQAQDASMAKWAIGSRLPGSTVNSIDSAFNKGEIIRTHLLRPTWHIVSSADIHWMLKLTAPHIRSSMKSRDKELELDEKTDQKCHKIFVNALRDNNHLTREELVNALKSENIATSDNRSSHILMHAELDGLICSGRIINGKQTYALLDEWVTRKESLNHEEALAKLALRYFNSHGPATIHDFTWWSGLPVGAARKALEIVKPRLTSEIIGDHTFWLVNPMPAINAAVKSAFALAAYDEFIISYKDRTSALASAHHSKAVSNNGIFKPVIVENGLVTGTWKRTIQKDKINIETSFFQQPMKLNRETISKAFHSYAGFIGNSCEISDFLTHN